MIVEKFFQKLAIPIDVAKEVYSGGRKPVSTYPVVGIITMVIGVAVILLPFFNMPGEDIPITIAMAFILILIGFLMYFFGSRSEKNFKEELNKKLKAINK